MGVYYSHFIIPRDNTVRPSPDQIIALIDAWRKGGYLLEEYPAPVFKIDAWEEEFRKAQLEAKPLEIKPKGFFSKWLSGGFAPKPPPKFCADSKAFVFPPEGESRAALSAPGAQVTWEIVDYLNHGTVYPLDTLPEQGHSCYDIEIHLCDDFTCENTDVYGGSCRQISSICSCGCDLEYETSGIRFDTTRVRRECPNCGKSFRPQDQLAEIPVGATGAKYDEPGGLCYRFAIVVNCGKDMPNCEDVDGKPRDPKAHAAFMETCRSALGIEIYEVSYYC